MSKKRKSGIRRSKPGVFVSQLGIAPEDHAQFKEAVLAAAQQKVAAAETLLETLKSLFRRCDPLQVLASCASYGLQGAVTKHGVQDRPSESKLEQFHVKLLQAVLLAIPADEWGGSPAIPPDVQMAFDRARELSETFFASRLLAHEETTDPQERAAEGISEHIRLHTQVVRNWAYFQDVVSISTELYQLVDAVIRPKASFAATDIIKISNFLTSEWERRINDRFQTLRRIARQKSARQVIRSYFKEVPELVGTPEQVLAVLPPNMSRDDAFGYVLSHFDLGVREAAIFTVGEVVDGTGIDAVAATAALRFLSLEPGSLKSRKFEHLHLDNPVARAPAIALGQDFFIPMPQVVFTNIHPIMRRLCEEYGEADALDRARAKYLERKVVDVLKTAFPSASLTPNLQWSKKGVQYETDLFLIIDETALIVEVKSHQLTPPALRGASKRLRRHVDDLILSPSVQSLRLQETILAARSGDPDSQSICDGLGIPYAAMRNVLRLSISLEDFSILSSSEIELKEAGWLPDDHLLAPLISLADLLYLGDILSPPYLLHYLVQRQRVQSHFDLTADEMDFLGMYLETLLNLGGAEHAPSKLVFTGMSARLDHYYMSRDAGVTVRKPTPKVVPYFRNLIDRVAARSKTGWTTLATTILDAATPDEQRKIVNGMERLKGSVRKRFREKGHLCSLQVIPPQPGRAGLLFYIYPNALNEARPRTMEQLAAEFFESEGRSRTIVIGRCIERWNEPYDTIGLFEDAPAR